MSKIKCPHCGESFEIEESDYNLIVSQIKDEEIHKRILEKEKQFESEKELAVKLAVSEAEKQKDKQIFELQKKIESKDIERDLAVSETRQKKEAELAEKDKDVEKYKNMIESEKQNSVIQLQALRNSYEDKIKDKDEQIMYYKDLKIKMSTKMIGETLEQHCETQFNTLRATGFKNAYFEKDNDAKTGSKGDYIFRDYDDDGTEYISIMFEMKNEMDTTASKHKNEDFFKELDKDRNEKHCEYAILVSLLEQESELYNAGIVDVSHKYPKMYVIRPQFFIPIITMLRNASQNSLAYKKELILVRNQNIDVSNFEESMNDFKEKFSRDCKLAGEKFATAIEEIDKTIDHLQKTKNALLSSEKHLELANNKVEDLSIKKLTKNNPTMAQKFSEAKNNK